MRMGQKEEKILCIALVLNDDETNKNKHTVTQ